jgi:hypothetical protein
MALLAEALRRPVNKAKDNLTSEQGTQLDQMISPCARVRCAIFGMVISITRPAISGGMVKRHWTGFAARSASVQFMRMCNARFTRQAKSRWRLGHAKAIRKALRPLPYNCILGKKSPPPVTLHRGA